MLRKGLPGVVLLLAACQAGGRPIPAPIPVPGDQLPQAREQVLAIARKEPYDPIPGASDRVLLDSGEEVTIEPQDGTYRLTRKTLAAGRVVAKLINHGDKPIPRWALAARGTSYWVVYQDKAGAWMSAFLAEGQNARLDRFGLPTTLHPAARPWRQAIAQWQLPNVHGDTRPGGAVVHAVAAASLMPWVNCTEGDCCKVPPDDPPQ